MREFKPLRKRRQALYDDALDNGQDVCEEQDGHP
jgi:hypothetical protein